MTDEPAISVPASPPRRNSIEGADATIRTHTSQLPFSPRKRIRLHSEPKTSGHTEQISMTLPDEHQPDENDFLDDALQEPIVIGSSEDERGSPPIMIIDDDDEADDFGAQVDAEDQFRQFPYSSNRSSYSKVVCELGQHMAGDSNIGFDFFTSLSQWLADLPDPSIDVQGFYADKAVFWDDFAVLVNKILCRRVSFGDNYESPRTGEIFYGFLSAYVRVCSFLLLVDVHLLSRPRSDDVYVVPLLSHKHLRHLNTILRPDRAPAYQMVSNEYSVDLRRMTVLLQKDFLAANGAQNLLCFADAAVHHVPINTQNYIANWTSPTLYSLGTLIYRGPSLQSDLDGPEFNRGVLQFLEKHMDDLFDLSRTTDANVARELIQHYHSLLFELCVWDNKIEADLVDKFLDFRSTESPTTSSSAGVIERDNQPNYRKNPESFPALVAHAWKFKLLRKYLMKGKMDLRVMSIATMDVGLVEIWKQYSDRDPTCNHPVMQYLADFLLDGKVVDYIISVDSHPQLIARSGNIVGFLVVTQRWSDDQADAIWNTVATNPDPRVVSATMTMLRAIVNLMKPADCLHLCSKLYDLPIESYTMEILRFLRELSSKLVERASSDDYAARDHTARPWNVCIRMICDTISQSDAEKEMQDLHNEAIDQLRTLAIHVPTSDRHTIYRKCAERISSHSPKATGSVKAIYTLISSSLAGDGFFFQQNQDITRQILEDIPRLSKTEKDVGPSQYRMGAVLYRQELLALLICRAGPAIPVESYRSLWDHTIGLHAISNRARDCAWAQLLQTIKFSPGNDYCRQLVSSYMSQMDPSIYTAGMFEFVANYNFPITRQLVATDQGERTVLQIPGADVLWSMILLSPEGTIEDSAARLLASRYVQINEAEGVLLADIEAAHAALVEKCMEEMRSACTIVRQKLSSDKGRSTADMIVSDIMLQENESRCRRIILFQKLLLEKIRQKPEFNRSRRADSKVEDMDIPYGDAITVRYQCGNDKQVVMMAADHTVDDLYRRLCHACGYSKINLFAKGHRFDVVEQANRKISDVEFGGNLLVQKPQDAQVTRPLTGLVASSSVFESTVVKHFDELFSLMDSDDTISQLIFDFLTLFPAREAFADGVMAGEARTEDLFPAGKLLQAKYAALALQSRLREQIRTKSNMNEEFLGNAIHHLTEALLDSRVIGDPIASMQELQLAAVFANVVLEFLRGKPYADTSSALANVLSEAERPSLDISTTYFSDGVQLADRLVSILSVALDNKEDSDIVQDCYGVILEASLHSRSVWEAFLKHADMPRLHQSLLLEDPRRTLRENIAQKIASVCGGDLPSTCPVTKGEIATHFWTTIVIVLSEAIRYPTQSQQLFGIAEHVFRVKDEYDHTEELLKSSLTQWSGLLLSHKHQEFVGRDETDFVVVGFTKLLLCCILSLKSFKKPINAGNLMIQIFKKYIFTVSPSTLDDGVNIIPILETHTRRELYDLMLALVDNGSTYNTLLRLAGEVESKDYEPVLPSLSVDRSMEIRSGTGYAGLYNPRAICYANSLLTQLFMNLNFRKFILGLELQEASGSQKLLLETQRLFTHMQHSFRKSADPRAFAACVKNTELMPIDISVQMDADEFYNSLFDQWERQLIKEEHKQQFRSFYGGQTLNQIKSKECEHVSERTEPFFAVQCDVQGKSTLQESLQAFVRGDVMEGDNKYKCESCGGKYVDAVKRTCFKEVPDNLIFHLKRFEFDLENFSRRKVYDHFGFPSSIDINAYHVDHLSDSSKPQKEDVFDLVGVLVHTGTCEHGHYYSYIRERPCPTASAAPTWVEFDDSNVGLFDSADIAYRAFGGMTEDTFNRVPKQFSAYMLFYQRRTAITEDQRQWVTSTNGQTLEVPMPQALEQEVDLDNECFIREYCLFDPNHTKFVRQLHAVSRTINHGSCSEDHAHETGSLHIVLTHLGHIVWRHMSSDLCTETFLQLRRSVLPCPICCSIVLKFLATDEDVFVNLLLRCPHAKVRSQIRSFFIDCLNGLREKEPTIYGLEGTETDMDLDHSAPMEGILTEVAAKLRQMADQTYMSTRGWDDFYLTLTQMVEMGTAETGALLDCGLLKFCFTLFCMHVHEQFREDQPELWRILSKRTGIYNRLIGFVSAIVSRMDMGLPTTAEGEGEKRQATLDQDLARFPLTDSERRMLFYWDSDLKALAVLDKILEMFDQTKVDYFYPGDIVKSMLGWANLQAQSNLVKALSNGIELELPFCDAYIRAGLSFCEASPVMENVTCIISLVARAIASTKRAEDESSPGGPAVLDFFAGLLKAQNEALFQQKHRHVFFHYVMAKSRFFAQPLLLHVLDSVREGAQSLICGLYNGSEELPQDITHLKWRTLREMVENMMHRIIYERDAVMPRSQLTPLISTCEFLLQQLLDLNNNEDPELDPYRDANDTARITQWSTEVEPRLLSWPQDDGLSGDLYDHSDFGSGSSSTFVTNPPSPALYDGSDTVSGGGPASFLKDEDVAEGIGAFQISTNL